VSLRQLTAAIVLSTVVAGCTTHVSGDPTPIGAGVKPTTSVSMADGLLPPRTHELDLSGLDPCTDLFTDQQLRELEYDRGYARPPDAGVSGIHGGPDCVFGSTGLSGGPNRNIGALVGVSTSEGALAWVTDPARTPAARPDVVTIEGFFALVLPHPLLSDNCMVVVDTGEGQYLAVSSKPDSGEDTKVVPYCAEAERVAGMAIQTISASR
jgi:uncharacterized protein DUF3558